MELRGLKIRAPFGDWILDGLKTWEIRGRRTKIRGPIALIEVGSQMIVGTCELRDVVGPLSGAELRQNAKKMNRRPSDLKGPRHYGEHTYAWVMANAKRLKRPLAYDHRPGAVIWVKLSEKVRRRIGL
jgi:hypothetical protein